jgi:hypothetical protein
MDYMKGITRYLFEPGLAKSKVESAVEEVSAASIMKVVSMQSSNRGAKVALPYTLLSCGKLTRNMMKVPDLSWFPATLSSW